MAPTARSARHALWAAAATIALTLAALVALGPLVEARRDFAQWIVDADVSSFARLTLSTRDQAAIKLRWLLSRPPVDVAVFGNSRTVGLTAADLGLGDRPFLNASMVNTGLNQASHTLEALAARGAAPRIAIVSIDPIPHNFWGEVIAAPTPYLRPDMIAADMLSMIRRGTDPRLVLRVAIDDSRLAAGVLADDLKAHNVGARIDYLLAGTLTPVTHSNMYKRVPQLGADGEARVPRTKGKSSPQLVIWQVPGDRFLAVMHERFRTYLDRLQRVQAHHGTRIILVEPPLEPASQAFVEAKGNRWFDDFRAVLRADAEARGLEYYGPLPLDDAEGWEWGDCCHPPPPYVARHLRTIMGR